jgi:hypothetical protein
MSCLLKHIIKGKTQGGIEVTGRQGRRRKQLLEGIKGTREYYKLKEKALDGTVWRTRFGRYCGPFVRLRNEFLRRVT